ncbi:hypothetical protein FKM82_030471 [Ascaphus truei]
MCYCFPFTFRTFLLHIWSLAFTFFSHISRSPCPPPPYRSPFIYFLSPSNYRHFPYAIHLPTYSCFPIPSAFFLLSRLNPQSYELPPLLPSSVLVSTIDPEFSL